jgi:hypothetical protein
VLDTSNIVTGLLYVGTILAVGWLFSHLLVRSFVGFLSLEKNPPKPSRSTAPAVAPSRDRALDSALEREIQGFERDMQSALQRGDIAEFDQIEALVRDLRAGVPGLVL